MDNYIHKKSSSIHLLKCIIKLCFSLHPALFSSLTGRLSGSEAGTCADLPVFHVCLHTAELGRAIRVISCSFTS